MKTNFKEFINENNQEVGDWAIFAGLGGGFGGASFQEVVTGTKEEANRDAYQKAIEIYDSYEGTGGLRTTDEIMEEDGLEEEDAQYAYEEERESWLDYWVEPYDPKKHD